MTRRLLQEMYLPNEELASPTLNFKWQGSNGIGGLPYAR
jgi:hypothetical protein